MELPQDFKDRMRGQLGDAYGDFLASYQEERTYGLRYNPLKIEKDRLCALFAQMQVALEPVAWAEEGFYYPPQAHPGRLALHEAGAYYIQEPSAMAVVELLDPRPGEKILDLCAAPGGKSTQIAGRMGGQGLLVANEVIPSRAKTLSRNIERMGVANAYVLNETPQRLSACFPEFFDRILVDAPCSGEGMFRKDIQSRGEWSLQQVAVCAARQREILSCAQQMLKPGGTIVYSTCTFAPEENEQNTKWLTDAYPQLELEQCMRLLPHQQRGEGHYAARFRKAGEWTQRGPGKVKKQKAPQKLPYILFQDFIHEVLEPQLADWYEDCLAQGRITAYLQHLYLAPDAAVATDGLKVERAGLSLGSFKKKRFEPSHALAMALRPQQVKQSMELEEPQRYLKGEAVAADGQAGWTLATVHGCSLGWGKAAGGMLKNHYPKGLRKNYAIS